MTRKSNILLFIVALLFSTCAKVHAQTDTARTISGVTIRAKGTPRIRANQDFSQSLNAISLERLNAIQLSDAIKFLAGATVKDYGGIGGLKTVSIRSLGASHTGLSVDGIPVNNSMNGQIDFSKYTLENYTELNLSNDNHSGNLQPASNYVKSNLIYLNSTLPYFDLNERTKGKVSLKGGSFGLINPNIDLHQRLWKNQLVSLSGHYLQSKGNYPFKLQNGSISTTEKRENSAVENYMIDFKWQNYEKTRHSYFVKGTYYYSHRELPGHVILYAQSVPQELYDRSLSLQGQYKYLFDDKSALLFNMKASEDRNHYIDHNYSGSNLYETKYAQFEYWGSVAYKSKQSEDFNYTIASDLSRTNMTSSLPLYSYPVRWSWLNHISGDYGVGDFNFNVSLLQLSYFEHVEDEDSSYSRHRFSPSLRVHYTPNETWAFRFFIKENYRMPSFNELYYTNTGNRGLEPEIAQQIDFGVNYGRSFNEGIHYFYLSGDAYYNRVRDKIIAVPTYNLLLWSMKNIGKVNIIGIDLVVKGAYSINANMQVYSECTYSFQSAKDYSNKNSASYKEQIAYTPVHSGSVIAGLSSFVTLQYSVLFSGERYSLGGNNPRNRLSPYWDHNLSVSKDITFKKMNYKLAFEVLNLSNKNHEIVKYYPMPGRSWRVSLGLRF